MNEEQIKKLIREELSGLLASDRYVFQKLLQIMDGRNIQLGLTTGTKIGTATDQKWSSHGATPCIQASHIADPDAAGGTYSQANVQKIVDAVLAILVVLEDKGLTATS